MESFLGKSDSCLLTAVSGAFDESVFDGNTNLLKISEKNDKNKYLFIGGDMVCSFLTNDKMYKYISIMGKNLKPYSIATGEENNYFLTPDFEFIKKENIKIYKSMERNENFIDLFDYHDSNCGKDSFKKLRTFKILSNYD